MDHNSDTDSSDKEVSNNDLFSSDHSDVFKFVKYKDKNFFIAKKFIGKIKLVDFYKFSRTYKQILEENNFDKLSLHHIMSKFQ